MADRQQHLQQITLWLTKLALLTSGGKMPVTKQQIGLYATIFSDEVAIGAFCDASLTAIAAGCEFFPAYAVLKTALVTWWDGQQASRQPAVEYSRPFQEYLDEQQNSDEHRRRVAEREAGLKQSWASPEAVRAAVLTIEREAAPAYRALLGRVLGTVVARRAPDNLAFVPAEFHPGEGFQP